MDHRNKTGFQMKKNRFEIFPTFENYDDTDKHRRQTDINFIIPLCNTPFLRRELKIVITE